MNTYLIFLVSAVFTTTFAELSEEELSTKVYGAFETCRTKSGVTPEQLNNLSNMQVPNDKVPQCFIACIFNTVGVMKNNTFSKDAIIDLLNPIKDNIEEEFSFKKIENIIDSCISEHLESSDECVTATNGMECAIKYAKKEGLLQ
ncbi:hypothetical protein CBL_12019 [Carabus blaptoides fortunei]